jgi:AcrR family transcriptional regulator
MRSRTLEKKSVIVRIAAEMFDELGYERASMSAIAARVGGSKATLYRYFMSKEELLRAVWTISSTRKPTG